MKISEGFSVNRKQRQAINKISKILNSKIIPIMEDAELPPFIIEKECCPIHTIEFSFSKIEKIFDKKNQNKQGIH